MKVFSFSILILSLTTTFTYAQHAGTQKAKVVEELKALFNMLNEGIRRHDQKTLESIYADEFLFIHGFGYIVNKIDQINFYMQSDSVSPIRMPVFDELYVYDNLAVLRMIVKNPAVGNDLLSTSIYRKTNSTWQIIQVQSTQQQKERVVVKVDPGKLSSYQGKYSEDNNNTIMFTTDGTYLFAQRPGRPKQKLTSTSDTVFFDKPGSSYTFYPNEKGEITHLTWRSPNGQEIILNKSK